MSIAHVMDTLLYFEQGVCPAVEVPVSDRPERGAPGSTALLEMTGVTVRFGGIAALEDAELTVEPGCICGLIGPNGAGKTTLFNCVSRLYEPERGRILLDGRDVLALRADEVARLGIARTFQNGGLVGALTVLENVMLGAHHRTRGGFVASMLWMGGVRREERAMRFFFIQQPDRDIYTLHAHG